MTALTIDSPVQIAIADEPTGGTLTPDNTVVVRVEVEGLPGAQGPTGDPGPQGAPGTDGLGVPAGGDTGQVLTKASATDNDTEWTDPAAGGSVSAFPFPPYTNAQSVWWGGPAQSGTRATVAGEIAYRQLVIGQPFRLTGFRANVSAGAAGSTLSVGLYAPDVDGYSPGGALLATLLNAVDASTTGEKANTSLSVVLAPGTYWLGVLAVGGTPTLTASNDPLAALFLAHRSSTQTRGGGHNLGASGLSALPAAASLAQTWDDNALPLWFGLRGEKP